jgi:hypothetical protein
MQPTDSGVTKELGLSDPEIQGYVSEAAEAETFT